MMNAAARVGSRALSQTMAPTTGGEDMGNTADPTKDPTYVEHHNLALSIERAGDLHHAVTLLEELCSRYPTDAHVRAEVSRLRIRCKDYGEALSAAQDALRCDPEHLPGHVNAGVAARGLKDLETSRRYLEEAVRIEPYDPDAQLQLGMTLVRLQEVGAAIDAFVRAIGEAHRAPRFRQWLIEQATTSLAAIKPTQPVGGLLDSLHEGVRWFVAGKLARAYRCLERARDGPCGLEFGVSATREAARTLLNEIWRRRAHMAPTPNDAERPCAPLLHLRP